MGYQIQGNVAIVTGGSQGFGKEFTKLLLKKGAKVAFSDVNAEVGRQTESDLQKEFGKENVIFVRADVTNDEDWTSLWDEAEMKLGAVAILVNNAGIGASLGWERNVDIMLKGVGKGTFLALDRMGKNMSGRIINIASIAGIASGFSSKIEVSGYTMAKHGVIGLTRSFPRARPAPFSKYGVKAYALCPWFADTQLLREEISDLSKIERSTNEIAHALCLTERQIKIWFQNRRMKLKKELRAVKEINEQHRQKSHPAERDRLLSSMSADTRQDTSSSATPSHQQHHHPSSSSLMMNSSYSNHNQSSSIGSFLPPLDKSGGLSSFGSTTCPQSPVHLESATTHLRH